MAAERARLVSIKGAARSSGIPRPKLRAMVESGQLAEQPGARNARLIAVSELEKLTQELRSRPSRPPR